MSIFVFRSRQHHRVNNLIFIRDCLVAELVVSNTYYLCSCGFGLVLRSRLQRIYHWDLVSKNVETYICLKLAPISRASLINEKQQKQQKIRTRLDICCLMPWLVLYSTTNIVVTVLNGAFSWGRKQLVLVVRIQLPACVQITERDLASTEHPVEQTSSSVPSSTHVLTVLGPSLCTDNKLYGASTWTRLDNRCRSGTPPVIVKPTKAEIKKHKHGPLQPHWHCQDHFARINNHRDSNLVFTLREIS